MAIPFLFKFIAARRAINRWREGKSFFHSTPLRTRINNRLAEMSTTAYWVRKAKFLAVPAAYYLWHLEQDPYDNHKRKFYMCNYKTETAMGRWLYDDHLKEDLNI